MWLFVRLSCPDGVAPSHATLAEDEPAAATALVDCSLDDDLTNMQLDKCLRLGRDFIQTYVKFMKRDKEFDDKCR